MQLRVGSYSFTANSTFIDRSFELILSPDRIPYGERHRWAVSGQLLGSGQADLRTAAATLQTALARQYQDIAFYADDGTLVAALPNAVSLDGVLVTGLTLPGQQGAVFATFVPFEFVAEASYIYGAGPAISRVVPILAYTETVSITGGGRRFGLVECVDAAPVKFLTCPATICRATQRGSATGLGAYPGAPAPLWPAHLAKDWPDLEKTPKRAGNTTGGLSNYVEFTLSWVWEFAAPIRLDGFPTLI